MTRYAEEYTQKSPLFPLSLHNNHQSPSNCTAPPTIRAPHQSWTLTKFRSSLPLDPRPAKAPAIGAPINVAKLVMLCAIPIHAPRADESGQMCGKTLGGRGTRAPDIPPMIALAFREYTDTGVRG